MAGIPAFFIDIHALCSRETLYYDLDMKEILFRNERISALGLGTIGFWSGANAGLEACIRRAMDCYGINVFDTAEMYGDGLCETALGRLIKDMDRSSLFLVDKILPENAIPGCFERSLDRSLERLGVDEIDLYLLHWREDAELSFVVDKMHEAMKQGKIRHWGVSNFDVNDLNDLFEAGGRDCFCNQIFCCLYERGAELDLIPFMKEHDILPMAYSSLGSGYAAHPDIRKNERIMKALKPHDVTPEAVMLRMNTELDMVSLFGTSSVNHLDENLRKIDDEVYAKLKEIFDREYPQPPHPVPLAKI